MKTLILNADGSPLKIVNWKIAFLLLWRQQAEAIMNYDKVVYSGRSSYKVPKIVRRKKYIKQEHLTVPLTKQNILRRDKFKCGYCGKYADTVDHIIPKNALKDKPLYNRWDNMVACCISCNRKKSEQIWTLIIKPKKPMRSDLIDIKEFY